MLGRAHALSGIAIWGLTAPAIASVSGMGLDWKTYVAGALVTAGAAVAPDLDHPDHSSASNSLKPVTTHLSRFVEKVSGGHRMGTHSILGILVGTTLALLFAIGLAPIGGVLAGFFLFAFALKALKYPFFGKAHLRTVIIAVTAALMALALVWAASGSWGWMVAAISFGLFIHVLGDAITRGGVPWLWPINKWQYSLTPMYAGGTTEKLVLTPIFLIAIGLGLFSAISTQSVLGAPVTQEAHQRFVEQVEVS